MTRHIFLFALFSLRAHAQPPASPLPAPELKGGAWLNVRKPLSLAELRGRIVLLHFWDGRRLSDLPALRAVQLAQARHPMELAVIGVLSGSAEPAHWRRALLRRNITHPVVYDAEARLSRDYGAQAPAVVAIDRQGMIAGRYDSPLPQDFPERVSALLLAGKAGAEEPAPLELALERDRVKPGLLAFPAKALAADGKVFIADTNNHRVVIADAKGRVLDVIGSGLIGALDGPFEKAAFNHPRGLAWDGQALYIADTENHQIRRADLKTRAVVAWSAEAGLWPWDLAFLEGRLFIASPTRRQILSMDPRTRRLSVLAGCGQAGSSDGPLAKAAFLEPAALAAEGRALLVADAAAGSLRRLDLDTYEATTLSSGSLKRPSGLAIRDGKIAIADAEDGAVKTWEPTSGALTLTASGLLGPEGLAWAEGKLLIVDTAGQSLSLCSQETGKCSPWKLRGLKPLPPGPPPPPMPEAAETNLPWARVRAAADAAISLDVRLPPGEHLNPRAPFYYRIAETRGRIQLEPATRKGFLANPKLPIRLSFRAPEGKCEALLGVYFYSCRKDNRGPCRATSRLYRIPIQAATAEAATTVPVTATID